MAKADLAQYRLRLHADCTAVVHECSRALRYSAATGSGIVAELSSASDRPAEVADIWGRTYSAALALEMVARRSCGPGRELGGCAAQVRARVEGMTRELSLWDLYLPVQ